MSTRQPFFEQSSRSYIVERRLWLERFVQLLVVGGALVLVQPSLAAPLAFDYTGSMTTDRSFHSSTLLQNGKVLVVGGTLDQSAGAELYDPSHATWTNANSPLRGRYGHTATLLLDGKVLVTGGQHSGFLASCELYDPSTGTWSDTNNLTFGRSGHTATLLSDGRVLVVGGFGSSGQLASAELYDPTQQTWTPTGSLSERRDGHTATLLPNGKVLVAGGGKYDTTGAVYHSSCELYDPSKGTWAGTGSLGSARLGHTATLLRNGKVLMAGGYRGENTLASAQLYDPTTGAWTNTGTLGTSRTGHTATLLPNGNVLVAAGETGDVFHDTPLTASAELFNPSTGTWTTTDAMTLARSAHTATLLATGKVLVAGGAGDPSVTATAELYDPSDGGQWFGSATSTVARALHTTTLLPNGQVLVAGGSNGTTTLGNAELYDPPSKTFLATGALSSRSRHTATLLSDGRVLVAGGSSGSILATAELYDRATGTWTATGNLKTGRYDHTATLLSNGKVLVTGGIRRGTFTNSDVSSVELFDPSSGIWTLTGSLATARHGHTATLLTNGKVLIVGGSTVGGGFLETSELYDPSTGVWMAAGSMGNPRTSHTATLLADGRVLVAGGFANGDACDTCGFLTSAEIYNPATNAWTVAPSMTTARGQHTATLLQDGKVLVYGGVGAGNTYLSTGELYDPTIGKSFNTVIGKWLPTNSSLPRASHTATLLPNGEVLAVGGYVSSNTPSNYALVYDAGFGFLRPTWQPQISSALISTNSSGQRLFVAGSRFQGLSEGSGGNTDNSATNYPVVQLRSIDSGQVKSFSVDPAFGWSDQLFESVPVTGFSFGPALVTVFVDGIPSDSYYLVIPAPPLPSKLGNISTRLHVLGGDNVLIAGMIASGSGTKRVIIRAIGPTLSDFGVPDALPDPTLELFQGSTLAATNDDWRNSTQQAEIQSSGFAPGKDAESAIIAILTPGQPYTATVRGKNGETGVGLVEIYDLDAAGPSKLANISTRGFVGVDDNVMIAGVIVAPNDADDAKVVVRALGPTLADFGVPNALANPTVDLVNSSGTVLRSNDDWKSSQQAEIEAANLGPTHDQEAALIEIIPPGQYTAVVRGSGRTTGVGLVEVYNIP
jgi:uncharacterized delta-60 repeat protein